MEIIFLVLARVAMTAGKSGWRTRSSTKNQKQQKGYRLYFSLEYRYTYQDIGTYSEIANAFYVRKKL
jgi:hypothetical protein